MRWIDPLIFLIFFCVLIAAASVGSFELSQILQ